MLYFVLKKGAYMNWSLIAEIVWLSKEGEESFFIRVTGDSNVQELQSQLSTIIEGMFPGDCTPQLFTVIEGICFMVTVSLNFPLSLKVCFLLTVHLNFLPSLMVCFLGTVYLWVQGFGHVELVYSFHIAQSLLLLLLLLLLPYSCFPSCFV